KVLVVEDDPTTRDAMKMILEFGGFRVAEAANGREALDQLRSAPPPCLILLDLMMPVMDGRQFREEQRKAPELASIPVVVVSADTDLPDQARTLGAVGYLQKPVDV